MTKLTSKQRKAMPQGEYALPGKRFPVNDKNHAKAALSMVGRAEKAGNVSSAQAAKVRAKADAKLGKSSFAKAKRAVKARGNV